jgi:hypothetical protein
MVTRDPGWALRMTADELNIDKKTTRESSMKIYGTGRPARSSLHSDSPMSNRNGRRASCQVFNKTFQDNPSFIHCIFIFPKVKTALKGESFQDVEDIKENINALYLNASVECL